MDKPIEENAGLVTHGYTHHLLLTLQQLAQTSGTPGNSALTSKHLVQSTSVQSTEEILAIEVFERKNRLARSWIDRVTMQ